MFQKLFFNIEILYKKSKDHQLQKKWKDHSKLIILSDKSSWVLDEITSELKTLCKKLKLAVINERFFFNSNRQCVFFSNKYDLVKKLHKTNHKVAFSYFHGNLNTSTIDQIIVNNLKRFIHKIKAIQVTNKRMQDNLIQKGIPKNIIYKIPISIDIKKFNFFSLRKKKLAKTKNNICDKFVVGSFQKDGEGWGAGNKPKYIKGPDILIKIIKILNSKLKGKLHVVLTGPARGYVKKNLKKINVSYSHYYAKEYSEISKFYGLLDAYIVTSREEGGPRAILESMASGTPIYSTDVGQAKDLIKHNFNGWIFSPTKINDLCKLMLNNHSNNKKMKKILKNARKTAVDNSYNNISKLWKVFFKNLLN